MTEKPKKFCRRCGGTVDHDCLDSLWDYPAVEMDAWLEEQAQELERIAFGLGASKMERAEEDILKLVVVLRGVKALKAVGERKK